MGTEDEKNESKDTPVLKNEQKEDANPPKAPSFEPITTQEEFNDRIQNRIDRAKRKAAEEAKEELEAQIRADIQAELDREADKEKGEYKKLYDEVVAENERLKKEAEDAKLETLKVSLLEKAKLPASVAKRIFGTTEAEIESDIKDYLKDIAPIVPPKEPGPTGPGAPKSGGKGAVNGKDVEDPATWGFPSLKR